MNYLHEFVLHASLDNIDEAIWTTQSCYLKQVDRYYDLTVSAYATSSLVKLLLLHDSKNDDGIRSFFHDIHEYYIKVSELTTKLATPATQPNSSQFSPAVSFEGFSLTGKSSAQTRKQIMLNPFHTHTTKITSKHFDDKVKLLAQKYLL